MTYIGRRDFIKLAGTAILAGGIPSPLSGVEKNTGKPNIVVIVSDDQGYGDASCYEHPPEVRTPNIDRLAASGVRFTDGYASGWVCAPTRAGLLTGRYQQRFGFYRAPDSRIGMPTSEITIADILPTICAAIGVPLPDDRVYDGRNMLPVLRGEATEPLHEALFWDGAETHWGVRMGRWKLVHTQEEAFELYDLEVDISETNNLARKHPEIVEQLKRKYLEWKSKMAPQMKKRTESGRRDRQRDDRIRNR